MMFASLAEHIYVMTDVHGVLALLMRHAGAQPLKVAREHRPLISKSSWFHSAQHTKDYATSVRIARDVSVHQCLNLAVS